MKYRELESGRKIPQLGLGLFQVPSENGVLERCIRDAAALGYRLFDTADYYGNEEELGKVIKNVGLSREEYYLTTKLFPDAIQAGMTQKAVERMLRELQSDYIDILLIHWPCLGMERAWEELWEMKEKGWIRTVGVSNFRIAHLEIFKHAGLPRPEINQVEFHPLNQYRMLKKYCDERRILMEAYGPFMQGALLRKEELCEIARKYGKTSAQVILSWIIAKHVIPLPKTIHRERLKENLEVFEFSMEQEDIVRIDAMNRDCMSLPEPYRQYEESFGI